MTNSEMSAFIDEYCSSKRNRGILKDRFIDGLRVWEIADKYELSERQINNIIKGFRSLM
jgi:Mor family transcriptional regulator